MSTIEFDQMSEETESSVIEITKPNCKPFAIIATYKPPEFNTDDFFNNIVNCIKMLVYESKEIYMLGDFNCDLLSSRSHQATYCNQLIGTNSLHYKF